MWWQGMHAPWWRRRMMMVSESLDGLFETSSPRLRKVRRLRLG
jgi:hypothetical protein